MGSRLYSGSFEIRYIVKIAVEKNAHTLGWAGDGAKSDKDIVVIAVEQDGEVLKFASEELKSDRDVVRTAVEQNAFALQYAGDVAKLDEDIVMTAIKNDGETLKYASDELRSKKGIVVAAMEQNPISLKYALGGLNQDNELLARCGIWDDKNTYERLSITKATKVVMSTRFSLSESSSPYATKMALALKNHPYFQNKRLYFPNAWGKSTCDPKWTDIAHPCRGTFDTCEKAAELKKGVPKEGECCWRYSFRYQLEEAKETKGFMIQVAEYYQESSRCGEHILGDGQKIEIELADQVGVKVFRVMQPVWIRRKRRNPEREVDERHVESIVECLKNWYDTGCKDMDVTEHVYYPYMS